MIPKTQLVKRISQHLVVHDMKHYHFDEVQSTNDTARQLLISHEEVIVTADSQVAGRGRNGHSWHSGKASDILFTYGANIHYLTTQKPLFYQACAALAVQAFLFELLPKEARIALKYPNDVHVQYRKLEGKISGSLIEVEYLGMDIKSIIVGIGINVNSVGGELNLNTQAITIRDIMHQPLILSELTSLFIQKFTELIQSPEQLIIDNWIDTLTIIGKKVRLLQSNAVYTVASINKDGFLVCNTGTEDITIHFGDSIRYELF